MKYEMKKILKQNNDEIMRLRNKYENQYENRRIFRLLPLVKTTCMNDISKWCMKKRGGQENSGDENVKCRKKPVCVFFSADTCFGLFFFLFFLRLSRSLFFFFSPSLATLVK